MVFQNDGFLCQWLISWNRQSGLGTALFSVHGATQTRFVGFLLAFG